ncbi:MAG: glycosyltransferase family 1 protein [Schleiferiaceae bacterium]
MDRVVIEQIKHLPALDSSIQYVVFTNEGPDVCLESSDQIEVVTFGGNYVKWEQVLLPAKVSEYGCDLLFCTSNTAPLKPGVPLLVTVHDIIYYDKNPLFAKGFTPYQRFGNMYRRLVVKRIMKKAEKVFTVSQFEYQHMTRTFPWLEGRLEVLYNAVSDHFIPASEEQKNQVVEKYSLPESYFLFLGNTDPKKNTPNTLKAFVEFNKQYPSVKLVVGDLDANWVQEIIGSNMDCIHLTGYIENTDLPAIMGRAHGFLYPSQRESFGIPILEGMGAEVPVITSQTSSMPEVAGGAAHLVDPNSIQEIVDAMILIMTDQEYSQTLKDKGRERVKSFRWSENAKQLLKEIKKILE